MPNKCAGVLFIAFLFLSIFLGCKHNNPIKEIKLKGLTILLRPLSDDSGGCSYAARLIPDKGPMKEKSDSAKTALMYRMDSCFYLQAGKKIIYAALVQPVANGLSGTFEYLVSFDSVEAEKEGYKVVYHDRYLNKAKYVFDPLIP